MLGGVGRGSNRCFLVPCPNNSRSKQSFLPLLIENIAPHTTFVFDGWLSDRNLQNIANQHYAHDYVVHEYNFVDSRDPAIHTQTVEGMSNHAKDRFRVLHGTSPELFD